MTSPRGLAARPADGGRARHAVARPGPRPPWLRPPRRRARRRRRPPGDDPGEPGPRQRRVGSRCRGDQWRSGLHLRHPVLRGGHRCPVAGQGRRPAAVDPRGPLRGRRRGRRAGHATSRPAQLCCRPRGHPRATGPRVVLDRPPLGPGAREVAGGATLGIGPAQGRLPVTDLVVAPPPPDPAEDVRLPVRLGPRADWFEPEAVGTLLKSRFEVTPDSDRVGVQLAGPALPRRIHSELTSEGVVAGSLQAPPGGRLLSSDPTTL